MVKNNLNILINKWLYTSILLFMVVKYTCANSEVFEQAEKLYAEKQYEQALSLYQTLEKTNVHSSVLFYNIANCHYKLQHIAEAIWYYEKALKLNPGDEDIKNNLSLANQKIKDNLPLAENINLNTWLISFSSFFSSNAWAYLCLIFFIMFGLSILLIYYTNKIYLKRLSLNLMFVFFVLALISWYFSYAAYKNITSHTHAIVFANSVNVKTEPNENSSTAFILHEGAKIKLDGKKDNWIKIRIDDTKIGWLKEEFLKEI